MKTTSLIVMVVALLALCLAPMSVMAGSGDDDDTYRPVLTQQLPSRS